MKILFIILFFFFLNNSIPAVSSPESPVQGGATIPSFYAPKTSVHEDRSIQSEVKFYFEYPTNALLQKAWAALAAKDLRSVEDNVRKIDNLYGKEAKEMQKELHNYPSGSNGLIFKYWALNDVGTAWFILGEAYHNAGNKKEAAKAFKILIKDYSFAQCWDPHGWFWKPASDAKDFLKLAKAGINLDFGDYSSNTLVQRTWGALASKNLKAVNAFEGKIVELYGPLAKEMQMGFQDNRSGGNDQIFNYWALNDVGTAMFILGEAYHNAGKNKEAVSAYKKVINEYSHAQCWDSHGWFWSPSEVARQRLTDLNAN